MSAHRRLLVRNDRRNRKPSPQRRAVKECYCYTSVPDVRNNSQKSFADRHSSVGKCDFSTRCGDGVGSAPGSGRTSRKYDDRDDEVGGSVYSPPLSTATLIRARKIDYTPRSKFLRKVQSKVNSLRSSSSETPRTPSPSPKRFNCDLKNTQSKQSRSEYPRRHNCRIDNEEVHKIPKKTLLPKKTIVSMKTDQQKTEKSHKHSEPKSQGRRLDVRSPPPVKRHTCGANKAVDKYPRNYCGGDNNAFCPCSENKRGEIWNGDDEASDFEINNVRKFREKNYFDTHASNVSLLDSRSGSGSGSIRQFRLNDRLFPEPMGRVHRDEIVVSIPPCATRQKKSIHYFPRSVVKQENNTRSNNSVKKRSRCPSCPLIGHAVDLGALKVSHPTNSLALRYQKGIP